MKRGDQTCPIPGENPGMTPSPTLSHPSPEPDVLPASPSLAECDAVLIALQSRRFVIVRRGRGIPVWSAEQLCRPIRELRRGEAVYYKGNRDVVRAMTVY